MDEQIEQLIDSASNITFNEMMYWYFCQDRNELADRIIALSDKEKSQFVSDFGPFKARE